MIECITKDTVLTILASHYGKAKTSKEENLIATIYHEEQDATPVRYLPERNAHMDKLMEDSGWE